MKWMPTGVALCLVATTVVLAGSQDPTPLPEGEGKAIVEKNCVDCHGLEVITPLQLEKDVWRDIVFEMKGRGANISDEQIPVVIDYLATNFGPKQ